MEIRSRSMIATAPNQQRQVYPFRLMIPCVAVVLCAGLVFGQLVLLDTPAIAQSDSTENVEVIYVVQPGDTLFAIARRYNVSITTLMEQNGLINADFIYVGQRLTVPNVPATPTATPSPSIGPTISPTATVPSAVTVTSTPQPIPTEELTTIYTVQAGETLSGIARRFETTVNDLLRRNGMANANFVYVGQRLVVPVPMPDPSSDNDRGSETNPIRINFATGTTSASVEGILTFPQRTCYVLEAMAGQEMSVAVSSGGNLANFLARAADPAVNGGVPLKRLENEDRRWSTVLPVSGDYILCVAVPEGASAYMLTVSIPAGCTSVTQAIEIVDWAAVLASDPKLAHEFIGSDDYVSVIGATTSVSGVPQFDQIVYGDFDGDCLEEAGIPLFSGGTAGNIGYLVYDIADEDATTGAIPTLAAWGEGYKLLLLADAGLLIVGKALYQGWEANCCPSGMGYDGYRLSDGRLTLVSSESEGFPEMRVETVKQFYTLLQDHLYAEAYALLSPEFQAANPLAAWTAGYANTQSFTAEVRQDLHETDRVAVELEVNERLSNGATRVRHYSGYWDLVWSGSAPGWILQDGVFVVN